MKTQSKLSASGGNLGIPFGQNGVAAVKNAAEQTKTSSCP